MKRIAIVTLNGYYNYGNRLQNYAVQEVLKSYGFDVETLIVKEKNSNISWIDIVEKINGNYIKGILPRVKTKIWTELHKNETVMSEKIRTETFKKFTNEYINETEFCISDDDIPKDLADQYDYFVVGSDQVWNPGNIARASIYFLTFVEKQKRIAFAPSFGVSELRPEYAEDYKKWISGMHKLSVREDDGAKIINELTGRDAPVLVDPTALLTKEKWLSISKKANNKPRGKYLLTYFLGGVPDIYKRQIKNIAKVNNLEVINLGEIREKETYRTGPSEFIDYISSCSILCTDSFHGAVFSILMEKPFIVYERMGISLSMFSRINTLLNKFDLSSRKVENIKTNKEIFDMKYSHIPPILEYECNKAFSYLKEALGLVL